MLRIAICMETESYGRLVERTIDEWALQQQLNIQIKVFLTGEEVLVDIEQTGYFDIVLLDTCLKGNMSGINTAKKIRQIYEDFCLIFISGHDKYYKEAFRLHSYQYLEKPVVKGILLESLSQIAERYHVMNETFVFRFKGMAYCIRLSEVLYFTSDKRVIRICMEDGREFVFYEKLDELERQLQKYSSRFFRVHQSFLINGGQVEQYHPRFIVMRKGQRIPVSTDRKGLKNYIYGYKLLHRQ